MNYVDFIKTGKIHYVTALSNISLVTILSNVLQMRSFLFSYFVNLDKKTKTKKQKKKTKKKKKTSSGPVVQSIVSVTSSLVVKMLTALVSTISYSQVFFAENVSSFCKAFHIFSTKILAYLPYLMIKVLTIR